MAGSTGKDACGAVGAAGFPGSASTYSSIRSNKLPGCSKSKSISPGEAWMSKVEDDGDVVGT